MRWDAITGVQVTALAVVLVVVWGVLELVLEDVSISAGLVAHQVVEVLAVLPAMVIAMHWEETFNCSS